MLSLLEALAVHNNEVIRGELRVLGLCTADGPKVSDSNSRYK